MALGGFILFFGFLAFNGGSQAAIASPGDADIVALAMVNTVLGGKASVGLCRYSDVPLSGKRNLCSEKKTKNDNLFAM